MGSIAEPVEFSSFLAGDRALADEAMRGQRLLFDARRRSNATERGMLGQRVAQHNQQIAGYGAQIESNRIQQRLIHDELTGLRPLTARGFAATHRLDRKSAVEGK